MDGAGEEPAAPQEKRRRRSVGASPPFCCFNLASGEAVLLDPPACPEDEVCRLRERVASALSLHSKQVVLLHADIELDDARAVGEVLVEGSSVTVLRQPCQIRPSDYETYIDRTALGCSRVEWLQYPGNYPADDVTIRNKGKVSTDPTRIEFFEQHRLRFGHRSPVEEEVPFPPALDISINMMPFTIGRKDSIPAAYQGYWPLIERCVLYCPQEEGRVGYLTIQESLVEAGQTQRRPGLHVESPGGMPQSGGIYRDKRIYWGCGSDGGGIVTYDGSHVNGGIFVASTTPDSCRFWNVRIREPASVVGQLGNLEHLREVLGEGASMQAGKLYWLTDVTPHETLPMQQDTYRQFFRFVTSVLSTWYPEHSTKNPLGIMPDPTITKIVSGSKFDTAKSEAD